MGNQSNIEALKAVGCGEPECNVEDLYDTTNNHETKTKILHIFSVSVSDVKSFLDWMDKQQKDYLGGKFMYDIKGYYKRLDQSEMFDYWLERVHSR